MATITKITLDGWMDNTINNYDITYCAGHVNEKHCFGWLADLWLVVGRGCLFNGPLKIIRGINDPE